MATMSQNAFIPAREGGAGGNPTKDQLALGNPAQSLTSMP